MVFTGYVFESSDAIAPYLELPATGPTSLFCSDLAKHVKAYVVAGYPEALPPHEHDTRPNDQGGIDHLAAANSAVLYNPGGELVGNYRKTNLYMGDLPWAKAGTGFVTYESLPVLGNLTVAICMDINSQTEHWQDEGPPYELADYCWSQKTNTLVLCNAWTESDNHEDLHHDLGLRDFWKARLLPLWANNYHGGDDVNHETIAIICNRVGTEKGSTFGGTTTLFRLKSGSGSAEVIDTLTKTEETLKTWEINTGQT